MWLTAGVLVAPAGKPATIYYSRFLRLVSAGDSRFTAANQRHDDDQTRSLPHPVGCYNTRGPPGVVHLPCVWPRPAFLGLRERKTPVLPGDVEGQQSVGARDPLDNTRLEGIRKKTRVAAGREAGNMMHRTKPSRRAWTGPCSTGSAHLTIRYASLIYSLNTGANWRCTAGGRRITAGIFIPPDNRKHPRYLLHFLSGRQRLVSSRLKDGSTPTISKLTASTAD